jgi:protein SCO1
MMLVNRRWVAAAMASLVLAACSAERPAFKGIDITGAAYARRLELPDSAGQPRTLADFKGKVTLVFFGFTQCPEVCQTTLAEMAQIKQQLGAEGAKVQVLFVTLDPERDTPEALSAYMANFGRDFVALRGTLAQTNAAAQEFKVYFAKVPGKTADSYTIDHTAGSFVFDAQGRVRLFFRYGSGVEAMAHDIKLLLAGA